jgi:hypothetical protein
MRPEQSRLYEFTAVFQSAQPNQTAGGMDLRVTPGGSDLREVPIHLMSILPDDLKAFRRGDTVTLQAFVTSDQPPPKLSMRGWHMRKTDRPSIQVGTPQEATNVAANMANPRVGAPAGPALPGAMGTAGAGVAPSGADAAPQGGPKLLFTLTDGSANLLDSIGNLFYRIAWSPDGSRLAAGGKTCLIWDASSGALLRSLPENLDTSGELQFSPASQALSLVNASQRWALYDLQTGRQVASLPLAARASGFRTAFRSDGKVLVAGVTEAGAILFPNIAANTSIVTWDPEKERQVDEIKNLASVQALALSRDGRSLLVGTSHAVLLYKLAGGKWTLSQQVATLPIAEGLWWLPGSKNYFATLAATGSLGVWDSKNLRKPLFSAVGVPVSWSCDGKRVVLVQGSRFSVQRIESSKTAGAAGAGRPGLLSKPPADAYDSEDNCAALAFSPVNDHLAMGYSEGKLLIRNAWGQDVATLPAPRQLLSLSWSPQGDRLASGHPGKICIWDTSEFADPAAGLPGRGAAPSASRRRE